MPRSLLNYYHQDYLKIPRDNKYRRALCCCKNYLSRLWHSLFFRTAILHAWLYYKGHSERPQNHHNPEAVFHWRKDSVVPLQDILMNSSASIMIIMATIEIFIVFILVDFLFLLYYTSVNLKSKLKPKTYSFIIGILSWILSLRWIIRIHN